MRDHFTKHQYAKPKQATMHKRRVYQNKNPKCFFFFFQPSRSQKIKVIQLLTVTQDITLDLAGINPGNEVLHVARNQESRIIDDLRTNTDMALLNESSSLARISQHSITYTLNSEPSPTPQLTALIVSTMPERTMKTANRRRHSAETVTSRSTLDRPAPCSRDCFRIPMRHSFSSSSDSSFLRSGSASGSSWESLCASWRREPQSALYLR